MLKLEITEIGLRLELDLTPDLLRKVADTLGVAWIVPEPIPGDGECIPRGLPEPKLWLDHPNKCANYPDCTVCG